MTQAQKEMRDKADDPGDEDLIARIAARDERAFRVLCDRYAGLLYSIAFRMKFSHAAAEDIVQEAWLRVWQHAGRWDPARGASVKTWLCRIAGNLCVDGLRKRKWESGDEAPERADESRGPEGRMQEKETSVLVQAALQKLPDRQRMALVMFHYEEFSVAEIAQAMSTSLKGAEGLLTRARAGLRQNLQKHEGVL